MLTKPLVVLGEKATVAKKGEESTTTGYAVHRHGSSRRAHQVVVQKTTSSVVMQATNFGANDSGYAYALASILEDSDGEIEEVSLVDADVLHPRRFIRSLLPHYRRDSEKEANSPAVNYMEARNRLGETFGTRKQRTAISSAARNHINVEALEASSAAYITQAITATNASFETPPESRPGTPELVKSTENVSAFVDVLPPHNTQTSVIEETYPLEELLPASIRACLPVDNFLPANDPASIEECLAQLPAMISGRLRSCGSNEDAIALVLLLHYFMAFKELREAQINSPKALADALYGSNDTETLSAWLLSRFAEPSTTVSVGKERMRWKVPATHRDRLCLWMCAVYLHLDGWTVNVARVGVDLHMSTLKAAGLFRHLGCGISAKAPAGEASAVVVSAEGKVLPGKWATLACPLSLPPATTAKRGGGAKRGR